MARRTRFPYWLFGGRQNQAEGGVDDLLATFQSLDAALAYLAEQEGGRKRTGDWFQLVDVTTAHRVMVRQYHRSQGWYDPREETTP